ncbi:mitochondrial import inner membrane translocase subunit TIM17-2-like [Silene latifolia]|uniref:mitochondrial import inner membrane translocase subunit TIM17-2-like n=1 Tax=Silene latifolia TaxID=37657 RepID=UPI003D77E397
MGTPETSREPCPDRILDDLGGAFAMGALGGSAFHFIRGTMNSPKGEKFLGGIQTMRMNAPRTGGGFAAWGGLFSTFDCTMVYLRQKEDPWNSIFAGAATGGFLQMRQGIKAAGKSAAFGAILLGMIEGAGIMLNRIMSPPVGYEDPAMAGYPGFPGQQPGGYPGFPGQQPGGVGVGVGMGGEVNEGGGVSGWFGGLFSGKKDDGGSGSGSGGGGGGGSETKVLESFDTPTAMPTFDYK